MPPYVYVTSGTPDSALIVVDTAQGGGVAPALVGVLRDASWTSSLGGLCVLGDFAYVCGDSADNLSIVDVSDPALPVLRGQIGGAGAPNFLQNPIHCFTRNNLCYVVSSQDDSLSIFDVSDPDNPTLLGTTGNAPGLPFRLDQPSRVYVDENLRAYVSTSGLGSLSIIDVSDPTTPVMLGGTGGVFAGARLVSGQSANYCYILAFFTDTLHVVDISDPTNPNAVGAVAHAQINGAFAGWFRYPYVFATGSDPGVGNGQFAIFNIANPALPVYVGGLTDMRYESARGIAVPAVGEYQKVFICGSNAVADSFCRVRTSNPTVPVYETQLQGSGAPNYMTSPSYTTLAEEQSPTTETNEATEIKL